MATDIRAPRTARLTTLQRAAKALEDAPQASPERLAPAADEAAVEQPYVGEAVRGDSYALAIIIWCFTILAAVNIVDAVVGFFRHS